MAMLRCYLAVAISVLLLTLINIFHAKTVGIGADNACDYELPYLLSNERRNRLNKRLRLEFVHIPKTGGSSVENVTSERGISWGFCKFVGGESSIRNSRGAVSCPESFFTKINWAKDFPGLIPSNCLSWHLPPYFFDNLSREYNPFYNASLFAVVRDPYGRLLSEYYYRAKNVLNWTEEKLNSASNMNAWLTERLESRLQFLNHPYPWKEVGYCFAQGHFIPQRQFIYQGDRKVVEHVLRFENLREDFNTLMKQYGLEDISLPDRHTYKSNKTMGVQDFTNRTRQLIEQLYAEDFETFNYPYFLPGQ